MILALTLLMSISFIIGSVLIWSCLLQAAFADETLEQFPQHPSFQPGPDRPSKPAH